MGSVGTASATGTPRRPASVPGAWCARRRRLFRTWPLSWLIGIAALCVGASPRDAAAQAKRRPRADRVLVPAGPFVQGANQADDERPARTRRLAAFRIDRTEVTRAMYARCVDLGRCPKPPIDTSIDADLPMTNVNWHEARAYCAFAGGRLPREAEWEKAARGADGREFPWGNEADCTRANWGNFEGEGPCASANPGRPVPVGRYLSGASPYGALDLGGNVWEWVDDRYVEYVLAEPEGRGKKGAQAGMGPDDSDPRRVVRGGSCCSYFVGPRAANRNGWDPGHRDGDLGFRCVSR